MHRFVNLHYLIHLLLKYNKVRFGSFSTISTVNTAVVLSAIFTNCHMYKTCTGH